jgi:hypothetical protein
MRKPLCFGNYLLLKISVGKGCPKPQSPFAALLLLVEILSHWMSVRQNLSYARLIRELYSWN